MHLSSPAAQEVIQVERDRKRPSTDPGTRFPKPVAGVAESTEAEARGKSNGAVEIATAFKDWVRF